MIEYQQVHTSKPLDETMWRAWVKKNLLEERQRAVARIKVVKWACIGALIAAGIVSPYVSTTNVSAYQTVVRFVIALGATFILFESLRLRQYTFAALFGTMVLLFNPVLPTFSLSKNWPILLASVLPFAASLIWMKERSRTIAVSTSGVRLNQDWTDRASLAPK